MRERVVDFRQRFSKARIEQVEKELGLSENDSIMNIVTGNKDLWITWMKGLADDEDSEELNIARKLVNKIFAIESNVLNKFSLTASELTGLCQEYAKITHCMGKLDITPEIYRKYTLVMDRFNASEVLSKIGFNDSALFYAEYQKSLYKISVRYEDEYKELIITRYLTTHMDENETRELYVTTDNYYESYYCDLDEGDVRCNSMSHGDAVVNQDDAKSHNLSKDETMLMVLNIVMYAYLSAITGCNGNVESMMEATRFNNIDFWGKETYINEDLVLVEKEFR